MNIKFFVVILFFSIQLWSNPFYTIESEGYFKHPQMTQHGIICTDNYDSAIYLIQDNAARKLVEAPGAGRFFEINAKQTEIGFKFIDIETGLQAPAVYDLATGEISYLAEKQERCSQVYFFEDAVIFMTDNVLHIASSNEKSTYDLPAFSNLMAISPDGKTIALRNKQEQIYLFHIHKNEFVTITPPDLAFLPLSWSPDGNYLLVRDIGEGLYLYHFLENKLTNLDITGFAAWYNSDTLIISKKELSDNNLLTNLLKYNVAASAYKNILHFDDFIVSDFSISNESILFTSLLDRSLYKTSLSLNHTDSHKKVIRFSEKLNINRMPDKGKRESKNLSVPYINQMYDTPQGYAHAYGACAAATAAMAIAHYNILPHWDTPNSNPYPHINHWGNYIGGTIYRHGGVTYNHAVYYSSGGVWCYNGIDNYHWHEGSPNSKMRGLLENHGLTSYQHWTSQCTYSRISSELANDYPYPLCVTMTASGHLILAKGFYDDSRKLLYYHDPYGDKNTSPYLDYNGDDVIYDWPGENNGYNNLDSVAWSVTARAVHQPEADLHIDILQLAYGTDYEDYSLENTGFYLSTTGTLGMRYWRNEIGGHNEQYWWTGAIGGTNDDYFATWRPNITQSGTYEIKVYIPNETSVTTNAVYKIHHGEGTDIVQVNQAAHPGQWVTLGEYYFPEDNSSYLYLGDAVGTRAANTEKQDNDRVSKVLYDAVHFIPVEPEHNYLYFSNFEYNDGGLTANEDWEWGEDAVSGAYSGSKVWGTVLNGNYHNGSDVYLDLNVQTGHNSQFSFYHWHEIEDVYRDIVFDGGNVKISTDGGANYEMLYPEGGYPHIMRYSIHNPLSYEPCFSGVSDGWEQVLFSLADYPNQDVVIRWHFGTDGATVDRGWYIDDVKVEELPIQLEVPNVSLSTVDDSLQLSWNEIENASSYKIYFCSEPYGTYSLLGITEENFFEIDNQQSIGFFYVVAATNSAKQNSKHRH